MQWKILPLEQFAEHKDNWDKLNQSSQNLAILHSTFIQCLIDEFFEENDCFAVCYDQQELMAAGFFRPSGPFQWASVMPSQAPVALWQASEHCLHAKLITGLASALPGLVLSIDFLQLDSRKLCLVPKQAFELTEYITTGNRPVPDDFDAYFASLGKNMRQNYNKVINRAAKAGDELEAQCVTSVEDIEQAVITYGQLESKGWKAEEGTAVSPDNAQGRFYRAMLTQLAAQQQACCWLYKINQQVVAVDMCVIQGDTLIILKTTYDEDFSKQSPALQLKVDMLRHYAEEKGQIKNIEFYGRVMQWHTRLHSDTRELMHATWYRFGILKGLKKLIKSLRG